MIISYRFVRYLLSKQSLIERNAVYTIKKTSFAKFILVFQYLFNGCDHTTLNLINNVE